MQHTTHWPRECPNGSIGRSNSPAAPNMQSVGVYSESESEGVHRVRVNQSESESKSDSVHRVRVRVTVCIE